MILKDKKENLTSIKGIMGTNIGRATINRVMEILEGEMSVFFQKNVLMYSEYLVRMKC